jgi:molecular chaperone GrpE
MSQPQETIERLKKELQEAKDRYLRTLAEVDNTKKRLQREKETFVQYATEEIIRQLLPVIDSLDQALVAVDKQSNPDAVIQGVHLIYRQLLGLLEKEGVKRIATVNKPFDPHQHEAVGHVAATDGVADETVVEEVQRGYMMHGKVIRPAIVKVAKAATSDKPQAKPTKSEEALNG